MTSKFALALTVGAAALACASAAFAGNVTNIPHLGAPAPLLGAGASGLAVLVAAGGGYLGLRLRRRGKD